MIVTPSRPPITTVRYRHPAIRREGAYVLILLGLTIAAYWKITLTSEYTWLNSPDISGQVLPWFQFQAAEWHRGRFPLWDPHHWAGQPLVGQAQPGAVYPLNWLLFLAPLKDGFISFTALNWYLVSIHFMAALFCYALCRYLQLTPRSAILAASVYSFAGYLGTTEWPQMLNGAVWAPLAVLFLLRMLKETSPSLNAALAGAALGISFLSGHHQIPIFLALMVATMMAFAVFSGELQLKAALRLGSILFLFTGLLGAAQILPAREYGKLALRWVGSRDPVSWSDKIPYAVHANYGATPIDLLGIVIPGISLHSSAFLGIAVLSLALIAVRFDWRNKMVRVLTFIAVGSLVFSMSGAFGFHGLFYGLLPLVEKARNPSAAVVVFCLMAAILAAYGRDRLLSRDLELGGFGRWLVRCILAGSALIYGTLFVAYIAKGDWIFQYGRIASLAFMGILLAGLLMAYLRGAIQRQTAADLFLALALLEISTVTGRLYQSREHGWDLLESIKNSRDIGEFLKKEPQPSRVSVDSAILKFNLGNWFGIEQSEGYNGVTAGIIRANGYRQTRQLMGETYRVGKDPQYPEQQLVFQGSNGVKVFRNSDALPRSWTAHDVFLVKTEQDALGQLGSPIDQLKRQVVLLEDPGTLEKCPAADSVEVVSHGQSTVLLRAAMACKGLVILADTFFPGWSVTIDGAPSQIHNAYGLFRAVVVPAGTHVIKFHYRPMSVIAGGALSVCGFVALICWVAFDMRSRRKAVDVSAPV